MTGDPVFDAAQREHDEPPEEVQEIRCTECGQRKCVCPELDAL